MIARRAHCVHLAALCLLLSVADASAEEPPHASDLGSMQLEPLEEGGDAYRLVWHAWHRRPGALTIACREEVCFAELRHTDGYGTYAQGRLALVERRPIPLGEARSVTSAIDGLWALDPDLPIDGLYGLRRPVKSDEEVIEICIHAPHYFIEARTRSRSFLMYRYCQDNYDDGLIALTPMLALFERLFPEPMSQVSAFSNLEERGERLREIE